MTLIDDVRKSWRFATVQVGAIIASIIAWIAADPTMLVTAWSSLPSELQAVFPSWVRMVIAFSGVLGSIWLARIVKQPKLDTKA